MKRFMLLHYGFEKPTPDVMAAWNAWFASVKDRALEHGGFRGGRELSKSGAKVLPFGADSITGYSIINAESLDEAEQMARSNPFVASIRIYEIMTH